jgi:hypothetical protein
MRLWRSVISFNLKYVSMYKYIMETHYYE